MENSENKNPFLFVSLNRNQTDHEILIVLVGNRNRRKKIDNQQILQKQSKKQIEIISHLSQLISACPKAGARVTEESMKKTAGTSQMRKNQNESKTHCIGKNENEESL